MSEVKKKKITALAKEYEVPGDVIVHLLKDKGVEVRSAMSSIDAKSFGLIKEGLLAEKGKRASNSKKVPGIKKNSAKSEGPSVEDKGDSKNKVVNKMGAKVTLRKRKSSPNDSPSNANHAQSKTEASASTNGSFNAAQKQAQPSSKATHSSQTKGEAISKLDSLFAGDTSKSTPSLPESSPDTKAKNSTNGVHGNSKANMAKDSFSETPKKAVDLSVKETNKPDSAFSEPAGGNAKGGTSEAINEKKPTNDSTSDQTGKPKNIKDTELRKASLKVKVEKPDDAMAARIAKYQNRGQGGQRGGRGGRRDGNEQGYTGNFGRGPGGQGGQGGYQGNRGPGGQGGPGGGYQGNRGPGGQGGQGGGYQGNRGPGGPGGQGGYQGNRGPGGQGGPGGGYQGNRGPGGQGGQGGGYQGNRGPGGQGGQGGGYQGNRGPGGQGGPGGGYQGNRGPGGQGGPGGGYQGNRGPGGQGGPGGGYQGNRGPGGPGGQGGYQGNRGPGGSRGPGGGPPGGGAPGGFNPVMAAPGSAPSSPSGTPANKPGAHGKKGKKGKNKAPIRKPEEKAIEMKQNVNRVMASLSKTPNKKKYEKGQQGAEDGSEEKKMLKVSDFITIAELAGMMKVLPALVIAKCMEMGMMVTINHRIDFETIETLADDFGYEAELMEEYEEEVEDEEIVDEATLESRAPVVTVMGHVDHGKTSVLDWIRSSRLTKSEAGGITQHIGAYQVETEKGAVTFLDTPGHEAFSAMRARGSQITDVVVLLVAADDRVMPQTVESIEHARAAKVPIVVAINKCDLETANPDKIRSELATHGIEVDTWGGEVSCVEVSAKTGLGMDNLLETLALETEILDLKANPTAEARGTVVESRLDKGKGAIATVLVQQGTLKVGDFFVAGIYSGRVRAVMDENGRPIKEAGPSRPCQIMGLEGAPFSGDKLQVYVDEKKAKEIASKRRMAAKERELRSRQHMTLGQLFDRVKAGSFTELNVIVKADVDGSAEAIATELEKLSNREVHINIIRKSVGNIKEDDVMLAAASDAIIIAFHLLPNPVVRDLAESEGVELKQYRIIYEIIEEFKGVVEGLLKPESREEVAGEAEVKEIFNISKIGKIAGSIVTNGKVDLEAKLRIYRNGTEVGDGTVSSLKRHAEEVEQVKAGFECGIGVEGFDGLKVGDTLAFFKIVEIKRTLKDVEK